MTDDELIEAMARAIVPNHVDEKRWLAAAKAALAVARPIIEAQEREKCALECDLERRCIPSVEDEYLRGYDTALRHMAETMRGGRAAAIRETGDE